MNKVEVFNPNWVSQPGNTISDILEEQNIPLRKFAEKMSVSSEFVEKLLRGEIHINSEIAKQLESTLGSSSAFWIERETKYRQNFEKLHLKETEEWINSLPVKEMIKLGWIKKTADLVKECLNYFKVDSIKEWYQKYNFELGSYSFRTSPTYSSDKGSVAAWLRQGEILTENLACRDWNVKLFEQNLHEIKKLTRKKKPIDFIPSLIKICAECGVAVAIVKTPVGCKASGATKFISPNRALILLSFRYLSDDHFWFTFFHEAGHLILHNKNIFIENLDISKPISEEELEANLFAAEVLIPHGLKSELQFLRSNKRKIVDFASRAGVSPGIVVGQLQFHGYIDNKYLNSYKRRYSWEEIQS
ncbi:MAG: ImmA/IrrE family metallo-endopeptidase [Bacteroidota bacterium]